MALNLSAFQKNTPTKKKTNLDLSAFGIAQEKTQQPAQPQSVWRNIPTATDWRKTLPMSIAKPQEQPKQNLLQSAVSGIENIGNGVSEFKSSFGEGWNRGVLSTGSVIERVASLGARNVGLQDISRKLDTLAEKDKELATYGIDVVDTRKFTEKIKDPNFIAKGIGQNLPNMLVAMGAAAPAAVIGAPTAVVGGIGFLTSGMLEGGFAYEDALSMGVDKKKAEKIAGVVGVINGLLETLPITKLLTRSKAGKDIKRSLIREITKRTVAQASMEAGTESIQEIVSNSLATIYDKNRDILSGVPESALFGGIMGGGMSTAIDVAGRVKNVGLTIEDVSGQESEAEARKYKTAEEFMNAKERLSNELLKAQIVSDAGKYRGDLSNLSKETFNSFGNEYKKKLNELFIDDGFGNKKLPQYDNKAKYVEKAIDIAKKENIPVHIGVDRIKTAGADKNVPVVYFETKSGQVSFHMPDWYDKSQNIKKIVKGGNEYYGYPETIMFDADKGYKVNIPNRYHNLFDKNYKWNGKTDSRKIIEKEYKETKSKFIDIWNKANKKPPTKGGLPELGKTDDSFQEARKFPTAEEFLKAQFSKPPEYGMSHRPSWDGMPPAHNLLEGKALPRDVYTHPDLSIANGAIRRGEKAANESWQALQKIKGKPNAKIIVYRAGPKNELNTGDWITLSKEYAKQSIEGTEKVHSFKVIAKDIIFAGDDINEFGYYPKSQLTDIWNQANKKKRINLAPRNK